MRPHAAFTTSWEQVCHAVEYVVQWGLEHRELASVKAIGVDEEIALVPARRPENLTDKQRVRLRGLLRYNLQCVRAYLLKEQFQQLWEYDSPTWAGKFLD